MEVALVAFAVVLIAIILAWSRGGSGEREKQAEDAARRQKAAADALERFYSGERTWRDLSRAERRAVRARMRTARR